MRCNWGDLITLEYGKPVSDKDSINGPVPVFGTNGQIGTSNLKPLCLIPSVIIGRKGAYRGVCYSPVPFSVIDTAFYVKPRVEDIDLKWVYYKFKTYDINRMDSGSAIPSTDRYEIYSIPVDFPPLPEQKAIAAVLSALDDKIELNNRINQRLGEMAQSIFRSWFESEADKDGVLGDIAILSTKSISPFKMESVTIEHYSIPAYDDNGYPTYDAPETIKSNKYIVTTKCILVSKLNPTTKRVWRPCCETSNAVCSTEFMVYIPKDIAYRDFLFCILNSKAFSDFLCSNVTGTTGSRQRVIPKATLDYPIYLPDEKQVLSFCNIVSPMFEQICLNKKENIRLRKLRDTLLPKLMSGELRVPCDTK